MTISTGTYTFPLNQSGFVARTKTFEKGTDAISVHSVHFSPSLNTAWTKRKKDMTILTDVNFPSLMPCPGISIAMATGDGDLA